VHCPIEQELCDGCRGELERLRPTAQIEGTHLADLLASHVVPDQPWLDTLNSSSEPIARRVHALTNDERLRVELARVCVDAARRRWEALRLLRASQN
jgi:hypothetical protein